MHLHYPRTTQGNKKFKFIAIIDDDESKQDSLQDLKEAAGLTQVAVDLRKNSSNPMSIVKLLA
jgi:hypothetical protein